MTIVEALNSNRPDVNVSEWLLERVLGPSSPNLLSTVTTAFLANQILCEVNMDGFELAFNNLGDKIPNHINALKEIQLDDVAQLVQEAYEGWKDGSADVQLLDSLSNQFINQSTAIENATHSYIRAHLSDFQTAD